MSDILVWLFLLALIVGLVWAIVFGKMPSGGGGFAGLTVFHDWQPKDKQRAIEIVIEQKAGKRLEEDLNGAPPRSGIGDGDGKGTDGSPDERKRQ